MKSSMALVAAGTLVLTGFAGCERAEDTSVKRTTPQGTPSTTTDTRPAPSTTTPGSGTGVTGTGSNLNTQMHQQAITAWKQQIKDLRGRVDQMKDRVDAYQGADKEQIRSQYMQLQTQAAALDTRVSDFKETNVGEFDTFRTDVESSMTRISDQLRDLTEKLTKSPNAATPPAPTSPPPTTPDDMPKGPDTPDRNPPQQPPATPPNPNDPG